MDTNRRAFVGLTVGMMAAAGAAEAAEAGKPKKTAHKVKMATVDPLKNRARFWIAALTPMDKDGHFDNGANDEMLAFWKAQGADGVLLLGTTGEGQSFSVAERKRALEQASRNKHGLDFIVGTGTANIADTIELSRHAEDNGADSVLIVPPYYDKNPKGEGLVAYFDKVFAQVKGPVRYYHIPRVTGVPVDPSVFKSLTQYPNFIGVKDSNGDAKEFEAITAAAAGLNVVTGTDNLVDNALKHGNGAILASGNVFAKHIAPVFAAYRAGQDYAPALARMNEVQKMAKATMGVTGGGGEAVNKYALAKMLGRSDAYVRAPSMPLPDAMRPKIEAAVDQLRALA